MLARGRARADAQSPVSPLREIIESRARGFHFAQNFFGVAQKLFSRLREQHASPNAVEQAAPNIILERLDRMAHRGLREKQILRGEREAPAPRERGKRVELTTIERRLHG